MIKINSLIKVGGSLIDNSDDFKRLVLTLEKLSEKENIILTTGSKDISDIVRIRLNEILGINVSENNHVDITWKSRDIVSQSFCDLNDKFIAVNDLSEIDKILIQGRIPVIIQYEILKKLQPFPLIRGLSTDTTSAYFSSIVGADKFLKLTNVDGVYSDLEDYNSLIREITTEELKNMGKTCICTALAGYLEKVRLICYVMNGYNVDNLLDFYYNGRGVYTKVVVK